MKYIKEQCDYPIPEEKVRQTVWEYYLESGIICLEDPTGTTKQIQTDYVMDIGSYGRRSFRQVTREKEQKRSYLPCDFGVLRARDPKEYHRRLQLLDSRKQDYVEGLPWPDRIIWHENTLWIREILELWEG